MGKEALGPGVRRDDDYVFAGTTKE